MSQLEMLATIDVHAGRLEKNDAKQIVYAALLISRLNPSMTSSDVVFAALRTNPKGSQRLFETTTLQG